MTSVIALFLVSGAAIIGLAAFAQISLPDALSRQHAATKAGTLGLTFLLFGAGIAMPEAEWLIRLLFIMLFLFATLPISSHLLARAAVVEAELEEALAQAPKVLDRS